MAEAVLEAFGTRTARRYRGRHRRREVRGLPGSRSALRDGQPCRVGVATKTNALMDQLVYHELPTPGAKRSVASCATRRSRATSTTLPAQARTVRHRVRRGADAETGRGRGAAACLGRPVSWGDLDAINLHWRRDCARAVQATPGRLHPQALPLLPEPVLPARRPPARGERTHRRDQPRAALPRRRRPRGDPAAATALDRRRGARRRGRGAQAADAGRRHTELSGRARARCTRGAAGLLDVGAPRGPRRRGRRGARRRCSRACKTRLRRASTLSDSLFDFVKDLAPLADDADYDRAELWVTNRCGRPARGASSHRPGAPSRGGSIRS